MDEDVMPESMDASAPAEQPERSKKRAAKRKAKAAARAERAEREEPATEGLSGALLWGIIAVLGVALLVNAILLGFSTAKMNTLKGSTGGDVKAGGSDAAPYNGEKPKVELFVMSHCPYGMQMQKATVPVMELLGNKADIQVKWVSYAMHGLPEVNENTEQYCIQKEQPAKYTAYLRCYLEKKDTAACEAAAGIDSAKIKACAAAADTQFGIMKSFSDQASWLSGRFPQYNVDKAQNEQYGVQGSPTLVINGVESQAARSADAVKKAICAAYKTPPAECNTVLSTAQEAPGQGAIGAGAGAAAPSAGCGV